MELLRQSNDAKRFVLVQDNEDSVCSFINFYFVSFEPFSYLLPNRSQFVHTISRGESCHNLVVPQFLSMTPMSTARMSSFLLSLTNIIHHLLFHRLNFMKALSNSLLPHRCTHFSNFGLLFDQSSNDDWTVYRILSLSLFCFCWLLLLVFFALVSWSHSFRIVWKMETHVERRSRVMG